MGLGNPEDPGAFGLVPAIRVEDALDVLPLDVRQRQQVALLVGRDAGRAPHGGGEVRAPDRLPVAEDERLSMQFFSSRTLPGQW